jgi:hypothetical protein
MFKKILKIRIFFLLIIPLQVYTQSEDSLLKQISEIEISLDKPLITRKNFNIIKYNYSHFMVNIQQMVSGFRLKN